MNYRRVFFPGASYFFTLTLQDRQSDLLIDKIKELRASFQRVLKSYPFTIDGMVVLPEHLHLIMTLSKNDRDYSQRISYIKSAFSTQLASTEFINTSKKMKRERGIWQRRFWEHFIQDEQDYVQHVDYIHYNPVKHGYVTAPSQWKYSSIHRYIREGIVRHDWASSNSLGQECGE